MYSIAIGTVREYNLLVIPLPSASDPPTSLQRRTRILCVDDQPGFLWVLRSVLDHEADMQCVGCIESCDRLIEDIRASGAEVVLLDATMPGKDPVVAMQELAVELPQIKTIFYSGYDDQAFVDRLMNAGAWGFVSKADETETILSVVREVAMRPS